jgi:hypothetical protein
MFLATGPPGVALSIPLRDGLSQATINGRTNGRINDRTRDPSEWRHAVDPKGNAVGTWRCATVVRITTETTTETTAEMTAMKSAGTRLRPGRWSAETTDGTITTIVETTVAPSHEAFGIPRRGGRAIRVRRQPSSWSMVIPITSAMALGSAVPITVAK